MADEAALLEQDYLKTLGGTEQSRWLNRESFNKFIEWDEWGRRAGSVSRRFDGKIPIVGAAITAASIGYDIHTGKPAGKAIISGSAVHWPPPVRGH